VLISNTYNLVVVKYLYCENMQIPLEKILKRYFCMYIWIEIGYNSAIIIVGGIYLDKKDLSYIIGVIRKTITERRKLNVEDVKLIVSRLRLLELSDEEIGVVQKEIEDYIVGKIRYFERKGNKLKIEEYKKIQKRKESIFEFFLSHKLEFYPKSQ
jgi:hypothetical protein